MVNFKDLVQQAVCTYVAINI